jgi:hypothetical protein
MSDQIRAQHEANAKGGYSQLGASEVPSNKSSSLRWFARVEAQLKIPKG